jgi:hypothetical protein
MEVRNIDQLCFAVPVVNGRSGDLSTGLKGLH